MGYTYTMKVVIYLKHKFNEASYILLGNLPTKHPPIRLSLRTHPPQWLLIRPLPDTRCASEHRPTGLKAGGDPSVCPSAAELPTAEV